MDMIERKNMNIQIYRNYSEYLQSETWTKIKKEILYRDSGKCRVCNSINNLHIHHRQYPKVYGEELLTDLITLCKYCHDLFHGLSGITKIKSSESMKKSKKKIRFEKLQARAEARAIKHKQKNLSNPPHWPR